MSQNALNVVGRPLTIPVDNKRSKTIKNHISAHTVTTVTTCDVCLIVCNDKDRVREGELTIREVNAYDERTHTSTRELCDACLVHVIRAIDVLIELEKSKGE